MGWVGLSRSTVGLLSEILCRKNLEQDFKGFCPVRLAIYLKDATIVFTSVDEVFKTYMNTSEMRWNCH